MEISGGLKRSLSLTSIFDSAAVNIVLGVDACLILTNVILFPDPRSAPVSPSPLRRAPSHTEADISVPGSPALRSGSGGRRKLGSRHGHGLGLTRGGSGVSQSFSPGDNKTHPRQRLCSNQNPGTVLWEGETSETNAPQVEDVPLTSQGIVDDDQEKGEEEKME